MSEKEVPYGFRSLPQFYCKRLEKFMTCNNTCEGCLLPEEITRLRTEFIELADKEAKP